MRERGFTLLELLVSMTVVSLLATTVLFGWHIAASAWGKADRLIDEQRAAAATQSVLERQITEMIPYQPWTARGMTDVFFQGEPQTARFLSRYSLADRARSGLTRIEYQISKDDQGMFQLVLNEVAQPNPDAAGELLTGTEQSPAGTLLRFAPMVPSANSRVLMSGLKEARFEYYQPASPAGPAGWVSQWTSRGTELPRAMALRIRAASEAAEAIRVASIVASVEHFAVIPATTARRR